MAKKSPDEMVIEISNLHKGLGSLLNSLRSFQQTEVSLVRSGVAYSDIQLEISAALEEIEDSIHDIGALISAVNFDYGLTVFPGGNSTVAYFQIDVDAGGSTSTVTARDEAGSPVAAFGSWGIGAGDTIELIGCTDPENNGSYVISGSPTTSVITFTGTMAGSDTNDRRARLRWRVDV